MRTCPKCKKTIENDLALYCRYCGTKLPEVPKAEEPSKPEPAAEPAPNPSPTPFVAQEVEQKVEVVSKPVPPPLPPLPNVGNSDMASEGKSADDEVTIIYTPSDTPPPIPNFSSGPSQSGEGGNSSQSPSRTKITTPITPHRKKKKGGSAGVIIAVVFILLIILGIIAFGLYYNGVFGGRSSAPYVPDYEYPIDTAAVDSEYVDNNYVRDNSSSDDRTDDYYNRDNVIDRDEVAPPAPVENYDNVDNVIERIGTDDEYPNDEY